LQIFAQKAIIHTSLVKKMDFSMDEEFVKSRQRMVRLDLKGRGITDTRVLDAMASIGREDFVSERYKGQAYSNGPLPIGLDQTISQPYIVALMSQELRIDPDSEVLEIGTGSGYQTAILAKLAKKVYTIERFSQLSEKAREVLERLEYKNIEFYVGDGIIITAASPSIPQPLIDQLAQGGLIVAPIGGDVSQTLVVCQKKEEKIVETNICGVRFVKLSGKYGFKK
jgi:protein-L-isoaspartate(D-aspartate) O-methyltransferase